MKEKLALILLLSIVGQGAFSQKNKPAPVVIIMADQLRRDLLGDLTPNINALRHDGVSFARAYCASPICVPSRASFFTGLYPNRTGSLINGWEEEDGSFAITEAGLPNLYTVMEESWDSWHVGKQHFFTEEKIDKMPGSKTKWITQGDYSEWLKQKGVEKPGGKRFRAIIPEMVSGSSTHTRAYSIPAVGLYKGGLENFPDHYIANESVAAIRGRDCRKPLLLNAMFLAPHPPFDIPDPYFSMFQADQIKVPDNVGKWYPGQSPLQLYNLTGFLGSRYPRQAWQDVWAKYAGVVKLLDDEVGRIIQALKEENLYDQAIIVFTADHGEMLGSHSLWQKMCMYEESAHVPLIIKFPRYYKTAVTEVTMPVSLVDVFPTLLDFNGLAIGKKPDGQSLLPAVSGQNGQRSPLFIQYDGNGSLGNFQRCVVSDDYKLIVDIFKDEFFLELYNVKKDPQETVNLALEKDFEGKSLELIRVLRGYMSQTGDRLALPANLYQEFLNHYENIIEK